MSTLLIRPSRDNDVPAIASIYAWHVEHGTGSFELAPPSPAEVSQRRAAVLGQRLAVARRRARRRSRSATPMRTRSGRDRAYRFCVEDSIYVAADALGGGVGRLLLAELIARCEAAGARQMLAVIGDSANAASIGVHEALGFRHTGVLRSAGWKFGRWLDVVLMQRALGRGDSAPAD